MDKVFIQEAIRDLKISKATIYKYIKKLKLDTSKDGKKTYLTPLQVSKIKEKIKTVKPSKKINTDETVKKLTQELKKERETTKIERAKNEKILVQLGQWQGRAKTLEEQNQKFLEVRQEKKQSTGFFKHVLDFWRK